MLMNMKSKTRGVSVSKGPMCLSSTTAKEVEKTTLGGHAVGEERCGCSWHDKEILYKISFCACKSFSVLRVEAQ